MADKKTDTGADKAPGADTATPSPAEAMAGDSGDRPTLHSDRMKQLREADDDSIADLMSRAPGMVPGEHEIDDGSDQEEELDDAEGQRVSDEDVEHPEGEGADDEEGVGGESDEDPDDDEGVESADDAGDEEGERGDPEVSLEELEEEDGFTVVSLPARHQGDEDVRVPIDLELCEEMGLDPKEVVERFNQMRNGYAYRQEAEAIVSQVEDDRAELDGIQAALEANPSGFIVESVAPEVRGRVVDELVLGLPDEDFQALAAKVAKWTRTPDARRTEATTAENKRLREERSAAETARAQKAVKAQVREIGSAIRQLIPETMAERTSRRFIQVAASELQRHVKENKLEVLDPTKVPGILADLGVLEDFNVPASSASSNGDGSTTSSEDPKPRKKRKAAKKKAASSSAGEKTEGKDVRERLRRRKRATSTPAGAGSAAASGFTKVPGESHEQRMERLSRHLGVKRRKKL